MQSSQKNTCARVSVFSPNAGKYGPERLWIRTLFTQCVLWKMSCNFIKKETLAQLFSCQFCEIFKNTIFTEHVRGTASNYYYLRWVHSSSVTRQGGESLNRCLKNTKHTKCSEGRTFLTPWYALFVFRKIWFALFSLNTRFEIRPFALLPTSYLCIWFWVH